MSKQLSDLDTIEETARTGALDADERADKGQAPPAPVRPDPEGRGGDPRNLGFRDLARAIQTNAKGERLIAASAGASER